MGVPTNNQLFTGRQPPVTLLQRTNGGSSIGASSGNSESSSSKAPANHSPSSNEAADRNDAVMDNASVTPKKPQQQQSQSDNENSGASSKRREGTHQINVFVLVRLLFHYLEKADPNILAEAKSALKDCDRKKREGEPGYQCLSEAIPRRLRRVVGDKHWGRALAIQRNYLLQKQRKKKKQNEILMEKRKGKPAIVSMDSSVSMESDQANTKPASIPAPPLATLNPGKQGAALPSPNTASGVGESFVFNPELLHRVVVPSGTAQAGNSPFAMAQRALAAQVEALNRASQLVQANQQQEQEVAPSPSTAQGDSVTSQSIEGQGDNNAGFLPTTSESVAAAAWQSRPRAMSSCTGESSDSDSDSDALKASS